MADVLVRDGHVRPVCYRHVDSAIHMPKRACQCPLLHPTPRAITEARFNIHAWHKSQYPCVHDIERELFRALCDKRKQVDLAQRVLAHNEQLERDLQAQKELSLCVVCKDAERDFIFHGCKHLCLCLSCYTTMAAQSRETNTPLVCPLCRSVPSHGISGIYK